MLRNYAIMWSPKMTSENKSNVNGNKCNKCNECNGVLEEAEAQEDEVGQEMRHAA